MPCRMDGYDDTTVSREYVSKAADLEAVLCGVLTVLESTGQIADVMSKVDWAEAGVTEKRAAQLWTEHKAADEARRVREATEAKREAERKAALAKLTPWERRALGL